MSEIIGYLDKQGGSANPIFYLKINNRQFFNLFVCHAGNRILNGPSLSSFQLLTRVQTFPGLSDLSCGRMNALHFRFPISCIRRKKTSNSVLHLPRGLIFLFRKLFPFRFVDQTIRTPVDQVEWRIVSNTLIPQIPDSVPLTDISIAYNPIQLGGKTPFAVVVTT